MKKIVRFALFFSILISLSGCYLLNPSIMLRTKKNHQFTAFKDSLYQSKEYKIAPNDVIDFRIYSNDGFKLIDLTSLGTAEGSRFALTYNIDYDGLVKLPILGKVLLGGLTIRQAELLLEEKYSSYYVKPYVILRVQNKRVIIFPGLPGSARVLTLTNNNTKLIEGIALAGGLSENGKARRIKLIRGDLQNPQIYLIDLSTIEGLRQADITLQGNDIIYVDPRLNISRELLKEITPLLSLLTSTILAIGILRAL